MFPTAWSHKWPRLVASDLGGLAASVYAEQLSGKPAASSAGMSGKPAAPSAVTNTEPICCSQPVGSDFQLSDRLQSAAWGLKQRDSQTQVLRAPRHPCE